MNSFERGLVVEVLYAVRQPQKHSLFIHLAGPRDLLHLQQGLNLGAKIDGGTDASPEERFFPESIAAQEQFAGFEVVKSQGPETIQSLETIGAPMLKHWGTDCFQRLNGFWALALYDFKTRKLLLSRDRLGKKPLFWTRVGSSIYFGSEIKALLEVEQVSRSRKVNEEAMFLWLAYGVKNFHDQTSFEGIHALPAGSFGVLDQAVHRE